MTVLINAMTTNSLEDVVLISTLSLVVVLSCLIILIIRALLSATGGSRAIQYIKILDTVTYPLVALCVIVIALRFNLMVMLNTPVGP